MPENMSISAYGHCYHALIVAMLIKAGVQRTDSDINSCFNFAEHLALSIYYRTERMDTDVAGLSVESFDEFVAGYKNMYIISNATLSRLRDRNYGLITSSGEFRSSYMYYFFLGRVFARNGEAYGGQIAKICEQSYLGSNHLILLFIIHHSNDSEIIDDIMLRTMCTLEKIEPATLDDAETGRFLNVLSVIPKNILSDQSVREERKREREIREGAGNALDEEIGDDDPHAGELVNDIYRVYKSNKILGQILRNKYGCLSKAKIEELVETIVDGGLRLVNTMLADEQEIRKLAIFIREKYPTYRLKRIENALRLISLMWTMGNIQSVVAAVSVPEIHEAIMKVVRNKGSVAYDIVGYFAKLDGEKELTDETRRELEFLLKRYRGPFVKSVLSLRTQHYINTHTNRTSVEQAVCSLLGIPYKFRLARV